MSDIVFHVSILGGIEVRVELLCRGLEEYKVKLIV